MRRSRLAGTLGPLVALSLGLGLAAGCGKQAPSPGGSATSERASTSVAAPAASLDVVTVGPAVTQTSTTVVLLHGYGAGGDDLVGLARALDVPASVRFVVPAAPLALDTGGTSRAWWRLTRPPGTARGDRSEEVPAGLAEARAAVDALLDDLEAQHQRIVLGGFSQGAMLTVDVALQRRRPLAGLAVLSGTRIDGAAWRAGLDRVRGVPVLVSHGTGDQILPFAEARTLRDELVAAGADVTWVEFPGGHTIPRETVDALSRLVTRVATAP